MGMVGNRAEEVEWFRWESEDDSPFWGPQVALKKHWSGGRWRWKGGLKSLWSVGGCSALYPVDTTGVLQKKEETG